MGSENKVFTLKEVSQHTTAGDCWVVINAKVYDVTSFLRDHPGGDDVLLTAAGKDASEEFEDAGHGSAARLMMDEYYVGETESLSSSSVSSSARKKLENPPKLSLDIEKSSSSNFTVKILLILLSLAILGIAVAVNFYS